jgi:hypothetical protein
LANCLVSIAALHSCKLAQDMQLGLDVMLIDS